MNRNSNSHFANVPLIDIPRSAFPMVMNVRTTFNMGEIIPFYVDLDGLPGDSFKYNFTFVIRQSTPLNPTMDNSYADIYWFKVPWRILWTHMKEFVGENTTGDWYQQTEYTIPTLKTPAVTGLVKGTIAEKMGIPQNVPNLEFSALGVRAYVMIYNYFFRDQNLIAPETEYKDDTDRTASNTTTILGGLPYKAAKFHDYFTSCLPAPQKGPAVTLPVGTSSAPLTGYGQAYGTGKAIGIEYYRTGTGVVEAGGFIGDSGTWGKASGAPSHIDAVISSGVVTPSGNAPTTNTPFNITQDPTKSNVRVDLTGVVADLSSAFAATINAQRYAFALQRMYEKDARYGTRMKEVVYGHFHVTMPDARYQIPEYLGGKRVPITMNQVLQTSAQQSGGTPLGDTGAFSLTADCDDMFSTSLTEWSVIIGLIVCRQNHSYCQGLNRQWSRRRKFDLYWPGFAHLGEMPVLNKELFAQGDQVLNNNNTPVDDDVFGYQEAWASYRYKPSLNTGAFSSNYAQSLDIWHYGDDYSSLPVLSQSWIEETKDYLDRTLAVTSAVEDQYLMDSLVTIQARRPMPTYSVPGLQDHY